MIKKKNLFAGIVFAAVAGVPFVGCANDEGKMEIVIDEIVSHIGGARSEYQGWPNMTRLSDGRLAVAYNGGREGHVCPFGRIELIWSDDDGRSWTSPVILADSPTDDRDGAITETANGVLLVNWFTSQAWMSRVDLDEIAENWPAAEGTSEWFMPDWTEWRLRRWTLMRDRLPGEFRGSSRGWMSRSEDGGKTWSAPYEVPVHNTHGLTPLADGRLLKLGRATDGAYAYSYNDDGLTWERLSAIPTRTGDNPRDYHELHAVQTTSGRIVAHIRNHSDENSGSILQTVSDNGGRTWTTPAPTGLPDGVRNPSHLLRLENGDLLMSYGNRNRPWPIEIRLSQDEGGSWSEPYVIYDETESTDMGYPSTVQVGPNRFVTVWYEAPGKARHEAYMQAAHWRLVPKGGS